MWSLYVSRVFCLRLMWLIAWETQHEPYLIVFDFSFLTHHSIVVFLEEWVVKQFHTPLDSRQTLGSSIRHLDPIEWFYTFAKLVLYFILKLFWIFHKEKE